MIQLILVFVGAVIAVYGRHRHSSIEKFLERLLNGGNEVSGLTYLTIIGLIVVTIGIILIIVNAVKSKKSKTEPDIKVFFVTLGTIFKDHFTYRKQIFKLAKSDLIRTYRGAALGWGWAIIKPIITIFVYWFAFSIGLRRGGDLTVTVNGIKTSYPFFLWLVAGIVPWFYMSEMLTVGTNSIRNNKQLVTKLRFPVATIPTFVSLSKLLVSLFLQLVVVILFLCFGYKLDIYYLQIPLYGFLMFMFFTVLTLFNSLVSSIYRDFGNLVKSLITAIFWLSGILWNSNKVKIGWLRKLLLMNPVTYICTGFRNAFIYKRWIWEDNYTTFAFLGLFTLLCIVTIGVYNKTRKDLPDVL
jgi:teichoic acid transport system permease protein